MRHNPRRFLPSFSIRVVSTRKKRKKPTKQWRWEPTTFAFPFNRPVAKQWLRLQQGEAESDPEPEDGLGLQPPTAKSFPTEWGSINWRAWWDAVAADLTDAQRDGIYEMLDQLHFYKVVQAEFDPS